MWIYFYISFSFVKLKLASFMYLEICFPSDIYLFQEIYCEGYIFLSPLLPYLLRGIRIFYKFNDWKFILHLNINSNWKLFKLHFFFFFFRFLLDFQSIIDLKTFLVKNLGLRSDEDKSDTVYASHTYYILYRPSTFQPDGSQLILSYFFLPTEYCHSSFTPKPHTRAQPHVFKATTDVLICEHFQRKPPWLSFMDQFHDRLKIFWKNSIVSQSF